MYKWKRDDVLKIFETLIEGDCPLYTHPEFRKGMTRNQNLYANQVIREANGTVAYRSVDFDIAGVSDEEFWKRIDCTKHTEVIEENAAAAIMKMGERFGIFG